MAEFNKKQTFLRLNFFEGESEAESPFIEVDSLPENGDVGEVYRITGTGELYCYLTESKFSHFDSVPTIASQGEAYETIGQLTGYDKCHILFTAKLEHRLEEFSCIVYTNSDYEPYSGRISSMQGTSDYGTGYSGMSCNASQLCAGELYFSELVSNAGLSYVYDGVGGDVADTIIITSITPLGQELFDFSTGGKVNITEGKVIK